MLVEFEGLIRVLRNFLKKSIWILKKLRLKHLNFFQDLIIVTWVTHHPHPIHIAHLQRYYLNKLIVLSFVLHRQRSSTSTPAHTCHSTNEFCNMLLHVANYCAISHSCKAATNISASAKTICFASWNDFALFSLFSLLDFAQNKNKKKSLQIHLLFISLCLKFWSFPLLSRWWS